jgi:serine/threonine protein kinase
MAFSLKDFSEIRKLGEGGMGNVYIATQVSLDRKVVIKELASNLHKNPHLIKRFENEAKSAAALDHENIIQVFDFGEDKGSFFISMEYIDGWDLEQLMHWQPFPREIGMMVLLKAIKGLHYAHKQGTVHCDIKPGNILVSKTGKVKVVDFGLAHASSQAAEFVDPSSVFITPGYMPPELALGSKTQDVTMDIWSAGVLAYKIICGKLPFAADNVREVIYSIVHEKERDVQEIYPVLPEDCAGSIRACLQKDPKNRLSSLESMIDSLENYLFELGIRDSEKVIAHYIRDKNSAVAELAGPLLQYHLRKGNDYLESGNRFKSEAHFREAERYGALKMPRQKATRPVPGMIQKRSATPLAVSRQGTSGIPSKGLLRKSKALRAAVIVLAIISIVSWGAASVFVIVQKNHGDRKVFPEIPKDVIAAEQPTQKLLPPSSVDDAHKDPVPEYAALKHELTSIEDYAKKPSAVSNNGDKRQGTRISLNPLRGNPKVPVVKPQFGVLKLVVEPAGSNILINGKIVSSAELTGGKWLRPGTYVIAVFSSGYKGYNSVVRIEANATQSASISLQRLEQGMGLLHVHSYPWADIYIDDAFEGTSPTPIPLTLVEGDHMVVIKRDGYKPYSGTVHVVQGETVHLKIELEPDAGAATVQTVKSE